MTPQLGGFALQRVPVVADPLDHVAHFLRAHAVATGERLDLIFLFASYPGAVLPTYKSLVVGHLCLLHFSDGCQTAGSPVGSQTHHCR